MATAPWKSHREPEAHRPQKDAARRLPAPEEDSLSKKLMEKVGQSLRSEKACEARRNDLPSSAVSAPGGLHDGVSRSGSCPGSQPAPSFLRLRGTFIDYVNPCAQDLPKLQRACSAPTLLLQRDDDLFNQAYMTSLSDKLSAQWGHSQRKAKEISDSVQEQQRQKAWVAIADLPEQVEAAMLETSNHIVGEMECDVQSIKRMIVQSDSSERSEDVHPRLRKAVADVREIPRIMQDKLEQKVAQTREGLRSHVVGPSLSRECD
jgi:hypothetical protein